MALTVQVRSSDGATVLALRGAMCEDLLSLVSHGITALTRRAALVIDVSDVVLCQPDDVRSFLQELVAVEPDVRIVCNRLSGRRVLRRCLPGGADLRMFARVEDAVATGREVQSSAASAPR